MEASDPSHQTQRIVFLIDLHPLLHLQNPNPYISSILSSSKTLLSFSPLSSSLFAFKLFFSSLSPLLSTSKIHRLLGKSATFISFDSPSQTLISLSQTLISLSCHFPSPDVAGDRVSPSRASFTSGSLRQITHDYAWEPRIRDPKGTSCLDVFAVRSNLVILFSPLARSLECVSEFMGEEIASADVFCQDFFRDFGAVKEVFVSRDIHFCWVDVSFHEDCEGGCGFLERGIKDLGWGFCSTDAIILGSALLPFGLIYPNIGSSTASNNYRKVGCAELSLQISDVNGRPLDCKCCDLELFDLKLPRGRSADISWILEHTNSCAEDCDERKLFWRDGVDGLMVIRVKDVWKGDVEVAKIDNGVSDIVLLRGSSRECGKDQKIDMSSRFFADKVLEILQTEASEFTAGKPAWQLLLSFLYRERYWGLVSISSGGGGGDSVMGILRPLTIHSAVLFIIDGGVGYDSNAIFSLDFCKSVNKTNDDLSEANGDLNRSDVFINSQGVGSSYSEGSGPADGKRRRHKKQSNLLLDFTWSSFCEAVLTPSNEGTTNDIGSEMNLEEVYFARESNNSKKLRFLKCWMKQMKRSSSHRRIKPDELKAQLDVKEEVEENAIGSQQESEPPISSSPSVGDTSLSGSTNSEAPAVSSLETSESFFGSISQKIQQSLNSEEVDLGFVAERLVNLCIHWFYVKLERNATENLFPEKPGDTYDEEVASEVEKLLLRKPRDLAAKYKACKSSSSLASDSSSIINASENKVREHELQILFRMEMLQSNIGASIGEPAKQKMVKDICSLLENIEFNLQGGMFGGESLVEFAGRTIKTRYAHSLCDVIHRIYTHMEFVSFEDDDLEASGSLPNSDKNDGHQASEEENDIGGNAGVGTTGVSKKNNMSAEDESPCLQESDMKSLHEVRDTLQERRLMEAQERRERARRFSSFTSWGPDLRRVWAPKNPIPRVVRANTGSLCKPSDRRKRSRGCNDVVLETPMAGPKHGCMNEVNDRKHANYGINSCGSVSKALFRNDDDTTASTIP
ncbi:uncharacterized protein LOC131245088 [Magnolia sinica]|uniref:uncharacterized protein LOC131245088 n=1 Tax=Magnolia sinica TaxID=86752 RepID=UPI0026597DE3|nr:uncharacterized protein LOC131245088 [Magnolia sinica]